MIYIILAIIVLTFIYMYFEARFLKTEHIRFTKKNAHLRILHITDIHISLMFVKASRINKQISKYAPDIIILTGDYIDAPSQIPEFIRFISQLQKVERILLCFGNHDYKVFKRYPDAKKHMISELKKLGVEILTNESITINKHNKNYTFTGLEDIYHGISSDSLPVVQNTLKKLSSESINIAFSHNPDLLFKLFGSNIQYFLCGHFHGGQIWMPFHLEYRALRKEKLCKQGIYKGHHKFNGINLYINRGLGNVLLPFRLFSRPEITFIDI